MPRCLTYLRPSFLYPAVSEYQLARGIIHLLSHGRLTIKFVRDGCDILTYGKVCRAQLQSFIVHPNPLSARRLKVVGLCQEGFQYHKNLERSPIFGARVVTKPRSKSRGTSSDTGPHCLPIKIQCSALSTLSDTQQSTFKLFLQSLDPFTFSQAAHGESQSVVPSCLAVRRGVRALKHRKQETQTPRADRPMLVHRLSTMTI